jgi:tetratricopeptide (TPR) repeat protein
MLADRGFRTGAVVSSRVLRRETGLDRGFQFYDQVPAAPGNLDAAAVRDGGDSERIAENWLTSADTERAFLFLHLYEPHSPYDPPSRFADYAPYDGEVAYADEIVGRLVKYLKAHQLYDQSTILLLSDHGEGLGDHGEGEHGIFLYDEALRVPLIVKPAAGEGAGRRVAALVQHADIVPTILDLAKAPLPGGLRGHTLKPLLDGTGDFPAGRRVYAESHYGHYRFGWSGLASITDGRYRLIRAPREELYDLDRDPAQRANLAGSGDADHRALSAALDRLLADARLHQPAAVAAADRRMLERLGYVGTPRPVASAAGERPDPKDEVSLVESYREAVSRAADREWPQAVDLLRSILRGHPDLSDVWTTLAEVGARAGRHELAVDAYRRLSLLRPDDAGAQLDAAIALMRLRRWEDARRHAELAAAATESDAKVLGTAHELLARIALARRDPAAARRHAALAAEAEPGRPLTAYVEGRLSYEQGRNAAALTSFEQAVAGLQTSDSRPIADLHLHTAETLARLERHRDAEPHFLAELEAFPQEIRARAGLAAALFATERPDEAARTLADLIVLSPTPEAYTLAARVWSTAGHQRQAAEARAAARASGAP